MAQIPGATFQMGSEDGDHDQNPVHTIHIATFEMDATEVTVGQYSACVRAGACVPAPTVVQWPDVSREDQQSSTDDCNADRPDRQDYAINCVDWTMADAYCHWAGKRLPTEEEWEYAACGGDCSATARRLLARSGLHGTARWPSASRVAAGKPGPFGLFDMAGNVWEWTSSAYCPRDHPGCDMHRHVVRGGSWSLVDYLFVRLTDRTSSDSSTRNTDLGFRCARGGLGPG